MTFPFFYIAEYDSSQKQIVLDEDTSKHMSASVANEKGREAELN